LLVFLALSSASFASRAEAQLERLRFGITGSATSFTGGDQIGRLRFTEIGGGGMATAGFAFLGPLSVELRAGGYYFSGAAGVEGGGLAEVGLGLRLEIDFPEDWIAWGPFAHANVAWTGPEVLPSIDVGFRLAVKTGRGFAIGPEIAYGQVFWPDQEGYSTDARFVAFGIAITWRPPEDEPAEQTTHEVRVVEREVPIETVVTSVEPAEIDRLLDEALPVTDRIESTLIPPVLFEFDSTTLLPCGEVALHAAREAIGATIEPVVIEGHADASGTDDYNVDLSLRRAEVVRRWLVAHGIDETRLRISAFGEQRPLEDPNDPAAQPLDRRVTFRIDRVREGPEVEMPDAGFTCSPASTGPTHVVTP
jgi:outer membrane protein OmpA-like peptidoglycan-associated protein